MTALKFTKMVAVPSEPVPQDWVRVGQICPALDISVRTSRRILERVPFTIHEATFIPEETDSGTQMVRVFSRKGALKLALLSRTDAGEKVALLLLDQAERGIRRQPMIGSEQIASAPPTMEVVNVLDEIERLLSRGELTADAIDAFRRGERMVSPDQTLIALADERDALAKAQSRIMAALLENDRKAVRAGYASGAVSRFRKMRAKLSQLQLPFSDGGDSNAAV